MATNGLSSSLAKGTLAGCLILLAALWACGRQGFEPQGTPCTGIDCSGHGQCVVVGDEPACVCEEGYVAQGLDCVEESTVNPCLGVTCFGYGTCAVRNDQAWCICAPGYHNEDRIRCVADERPCSGPDGTPCDDGRFCTVGDTCQQGYCVGTVNPCDDQDPCTVDTCNSLEDECVNTVAPDGAPCDDGRFCSMGESCLAGVCGGGITRGCGDGNPCTDDFCDDQSERCQNLPVADGTACEDGAFCTVGEVCSNGSCGGGAARNCSDGNPCTVDSCDEVNDLCVNNAAAANGLACDDGLYCNVGETCTNWICAGGGPRNCADTNQCTVDSCNEAQDRCEHDAAAANGLACNDGLFCNVGETCLNGSCQGGAANSCSDGNPCTVDTCNESQDRCDYDTAAANGMPCDDGLFCNGIDHCQNGSCQAGTTNPCGVENPCASGCDEVNDTCIGCVPAGTVCKNTVQEAICDGSCNMTQLLICQYGCNLGRGECNECEPSTTECKGDALQLCNAEFVCSTDGRLLAVNCCSTNRCICDGSACLEDECFMSTDVSAGGTFSGTTCDDYDHLPGDCYPGGTACRTPAQGGAPEHMFQFTLSDGNPNTYSFYTVALDTAGSAIDTGLRVSRVCGSETKTIPFATVCGSPVGTAPLTSCSQAPTTRDSMRLCGLPEGTYYGAVESPAGACGGFIMSVTRSQVNLDTAPFAGNISLGGTFRGNTCSLNSDYSFPDTWGWAQGNCGNCQKIGPTWYCPVCTVTAATDCTLAPNSTDENCAYSGAGSKDAVFYLALEMDAGVDISTLGSDFDTVLYIMQTGPTGAQPPGARRVCNDDCWWSDGPSHIQTSLPAGVYYVYVDGAGGACGNYILSVNISPSAECGNLICEPPAESCLTCPFDCPCYPTFNVDRTSNCNCAIPDGGTLNSWALHLVCY